VTVDAETFERIAEHVHIGWMQEKQRQGFADHAFTGQVLFEDGKRIGTHPAFCAVPQCSKLPSEHHPDMLPYADLAENVKDYDRATVRAVLAGIDAAGLKIVPA
jgi:2,4-dienoyl-CoA reductase-like NADH-dependent reductase (Old Yellow Enzyme family)